MKQGVVLYEPIGGMCAGLEACLNGIRVKKYFDTDPDHAARQMVRHRLAALSGVHPNYLPLEVWEDDFTLAPNGVADLTAAEMLRTGAGAGKQWMLIAYWGEGESRARQEALRAAAMLNDACRNVVPAVVAVHKTSPREITGGTHNCAEWGGGIVQYAVVFGSMNHQLYCSQSFISNARHLK